MTRGAITAGASILLGACLAACSSSSKPASTGSPTTGSSNSTGSTSAATGAPLAYGVISSDSGTSGTTTDVPTTVHNWVNYVNSHGGINGHPVKLYYFNDGDSAATSIQDATTLIQQDHVIAIGDASSTATSFVKVADAAHVPIISLIGNHQSPSYLTDDNAFTDGATILTEFWAYAKAPQLAGAKKLAVLYCAEVAQCSQLVGAVKQNATPLGVRIVYSAGFSGSAPNYTSVCLAAKSAGADAIEPVGPIVTANVRVLKDCAAQGYHPIPVESGTNLGTVASIKSEGVPTFWGYTNSLPWFVNDSATQTFQQVMGSYLPKASSDQNVMDTWVGLQLFAAAASGVPAGAQPTSTDLYNKLYSMSNETLGGLAPPLTFKQGQGNPSDCAFFIKYQNGTLSTPEGTNALCEASAGSAG